MKRGPRTGSGADSRSNVEKVAQAWADVPDWVTELAIYADAHSAKAAAQAIGYSPAAVSVVINRTEALEKFDLPRIEQAVRGALMGMVVICPIIGEMSRDTCLEWQRKPKASTSAYRMRMFRACRNNCPNFLAKGGSNGLE